VKIVYVTKENRSSIVCVRREKQAGNSDKVDIVIETSKFLVIEHSVFSAAQYKTKYISLSD
jgi:hypothetical protein